jgi:hypothetical protein
MFSMGRRPKNELANLARSSRAQLALAEELIASLKLRMKMKREVSPEWVPDEDWRRDFASATNTLQHAGNSLIRALEGNKKNLGGLTEEQLVAQFNAEIVSSAATLTDEQWGRMCEARAKARR